VYVEDKKNERNQTMTVAETIKLAERHAAADNVQGACRILDAAQRAAKSNKSQWAFEIAKANILWRAVDDMVARSQVAA
jgi:hypothetical protein